MFRDFGNTQTDRPTKSPIQVRDPMGRVTHLKSKFSVLSNLSKQIELDSNLILLSLTTATQFKLYHTQNNCSILKSLNYAKISVKRRNFSQNISEAKKVKKIARMMMFDALFFYPPYAKLDTKTPPQ